MTLLSPNVYAKRALDAAGNGLFASKACGAGEEIFRIDRPLISVLDSPHLRDTCSGCYEWVPINGVGQSGEEKGPKIILRACQGCRVDRYCSKVGSRPSFVD